MVDVEKCPYIEYKIQGISGIVAKEEKAFCVKDDLIIQIELKQEGLEITGLKVLLKEDIVIDEQVKQAIRRKIEHFLVNLIAGREVGSLISMVLRAFLSIQFRSALVYGTSG